MSEHYDEAALTLDELADRISDDEATVDQRLTWASIHASLAATAAIKAQTAVLEGAQENVVHLIGQQERAIDIDTARLAAQFRAKNRRWRRTATPQPDHDDAAVSGGGQRGEPVTSEDETAGVCIVVTNPPKREEHPCEHGHRWAWAQLVSGGVRQVCRVCGRERR